MLCCVHCHGVCVCLAVRRGKTKAKGKFLVTQYLVDMQKKFLIATDISTGTSWCIQPEEDIADRALFAKHVQELVGSMLKTKTMPPKGVGVIIVDEDDWARLTTNCLTNFGGDIQRMLHTWGMKGLPSKITMISGAHTLDSFMKLQDMYPDNPKYRNMPFSALYLVPRNNNGLRFMRNMGALHNYTASLHKVSPFWDRVKNIHRALIMIPEDWKQGSKARRAAEAQVKDDTLGTTDMTSGVYGQAKTVARLTGKLWEHMVRIYTGQCNPPRGSKHPAKPPGGASFFVNIGPLPDDVLEQLLGEVVAGKMSLQQFKIKVDTVRAEIRITDHICDIAEIEVGEMSGLWEFEGEQAQFMMTWCGVLVKQKASDPMPAEFNKALAAVIRSADRRPASFAALLPICRNHDQSAVNVLHSVPER